MLSRATGYGTALRGLALKGSPILEGPELFTGSFGRRDFRWKSDKLAEWHVRRISGTQVEAVFFQ